MISIVVPAHNEAAVIGQTLSALIRDAESDELDIVVAANGCTDDTEQIAAAFGPPVRVVHVDASSKTAALNAGDALAKGFPRLYLDADVELSTQAVRAIAAALEGPVLAVSPGLFVDTAESSQLVRSYYRFWSRLPSVVDDLVGRGVYAVSEQGRRRFDLFPDVLNDDHFFREMFSTSERRIVRGCVSRVRAPKSTASLIGRKTRVQLGNRSGPRQVGGPWAGVSGVLRRDPLRIVDFPAFAYVAVRARFAARQAQAGRRPVEWGRDDSRPVSESEG